VLPEHAQRILEIVSETEGPEIAWRVLRRLARDFGGRQFYIPSIEAQDREQRNAEIRRAYDGTCDGRHGVGALARRYGLSRSQIRKIIQAAPTSPASV
jgi:Mor family transcriptional regulator